MCTRGAQAGLFYRGYDMEEKDTMEFKAPMPGDGGVLIKAEEGENGERIVYLEASRDTPDQEGETLESSALKKAKQHFLDHGVVSWDHMHKSGERDPKYIIGEPIDVQFTDDGRTLVKARLYTENKIAQSLWDNIKSGAKRLGASVGGGILKKASDKIKQVVWDEIAITHKPVHDGTLGNVSMVPFTEFAKAVEYCDGYTTAIDMDYDISHEMYLDSMSDGMRERYEGNTLIKALMAGSGADASTFEGGRALTGESLQGNVNKIDEQELKYIYKSVVMGMIDGSIKSYNDMVSEVLSKGYPDDISKRIIKTIATNAPSVAGQLRD